MACDIRRGHTWRAMSLLPLLLLQYAACGSSPTEPSPDAVVLRISVAEKHDGNIELRASVSNNTLGTIQRSEGCTLYSGMNIYLVSKSQGDLFPVDWTELPPCGTTRVPMAPGVTFEEVLVIDGTLYRSNGTPVQMLQEHYWAFAKFSWLPPGADTLHTLYHSVVFEWTPHPEG